VNKHIPEDENLYRLPVRAPNFGGPRGPRFAGVMSARVPPGWFAKESLTLLAPDGQANVIASSEPLAPDIDSRDYAEAQGHLLSREFPHFVEYLFERVRVFGDRDGWQREFAWTPPEGVEVAQIQLYFAEHGRGFTATATTPSGNFASRETTVLRDVLAHLRIRSQP
jgi:hypothetical protein